jgi:catabolite regulation protein CreA
MSAHVVASRSVVVVATTRRARAPVSVRATTTPRERASRRSASSSPEDGDDATTTRRARATACAAACALALASSPLASVAAGAESTTIAEFNASGIVFKDAVNVVALRDPDVSGVTLYLSDFSRSLSAKAKSGDFFTEPSQTSLGCVRAETVRVDGDIAGFQGKELFSERKNINFLNQKNLKVRRVFDAANDVVLYVSYSTRTASSSKDDGPSAGQYKTSVCAIQLKPGEATGGSAAPS